MEEDVHRRVFLTGGASAAALGGAYGATPAQPSAVRVGRSEIDGVRVVAQAVKVKDMRAGGGSGLDEALREASDALLLRHAHVPDTLRPELLTAIGWLATEVGFKLHDVGRDSEAAQWWTAANGAATESANWSLRARILAVQARQAIWLGRPQAALADLDYALAGDNRGVLTASERAMIHDLRARAHARARNPGEAQWAIEAADAEMAAGRVDDDLSPRPWVAHYTVAHHHGDCAAALGMLARDGVPGTLSGAGGRMEASARGHKPETTRSWVLSMLMLATLDMEMSDVERAARWGHDVLDVVSSVQSQRVRAEIGRLQAACAQHPERPDVADLHDRCAEALTP